MLLNMSNTDTFQCKALNAVYESYKRMVSDQAASREGLAIKEKKQPMYTWIIHSTVSRRLDKMDKFT